VNKVGELWELDLAYMDSLASHNDGHRYNLNTNDAFSKYAYTLPIRSKTGDTIAGFANGQGQGVC